MASPMASSTPKISSLKRTKTMPLDLNVNKKTNLTFDHPSAPDLDEETQFSWPSNPSNSPQSQSPPPTVSSLQKGVDEAGCRPLNVGKPVSFYSKPIGTCRYTFLMANPMFPSESFTENKTWVNYYQAGKDLI